MARMLGTDHADRERIPSMFDAVGAFFDMLGAGMRLPGPDGKKLTALKGFITVDLCMVYGVCVLPEGGMGETTTPPLIGGGDAGGRSEERRVGKEWVRKCRSRGSTYQ